MRIWISILGLLAAAGGCQAADTVVWAEAEGFAQTGGWCNDSQFVDLMGSPYLLAAGTGKPVADAVTQVAIPAAGRYRLHVRCKDWLPSHSPGRFEVLVGGRASSSLGQAKTDAWGWVQAGTFDLPAGPVEIRLHDLTGWWGRCDAIVLATGDLHGEDDPARLAAQRERWGGVSREVRDAGAYDVVVVGGGLAGCGAAVAAARHGCRVAFIQDRPVLGGNASSEIQVPVEGDRTHQRWDPFDTGLIEEFYPEMRDTGQSVRVEQIVRAEKGIDLRLNTRATGVQMKSKDRIEAVLALDVVTGKRWRFSAPTFIDCTGHGWVGFWAGAEYRVGEEARGEHDEPSAPLVATKHTMGNDLYTAGVRRADGPVAFQAPAWAYHWTKAQDFEPLASHKRQDSGRPANFDAPSRGTGRQPSPSDPNGGTLHCWEIEYGGMNDTIADAERIRDELFRINIGLWDYAKNHNPRVHADNADRELVWLNYVMGVRESRRLLGDYVLTENDLIRRTIHGDTVAFTGWGMDVHHPEGFWVRGNDCMHYYRDRKVSIPFGSLYSRNIDNLLMAGRCHSATHLAMGATRIMRTCCEMGQAVGAAAALMKERSVTPRQLRDRYIVDLQQALLRDGCYLMGVPNQDPLDLALRAKASASSSAHPADDVDMVEPRGGTVHRLDRDRAVQFLAPGDRLDAVALFLDNQTDRAIPLRAALRQAGRFGDFSADKDLASARVDVPARSAGWVDLPLSAQTDKDKPYFVLLPATKGLAWRLYAPAMRDCCRAYRADSGDLTRMPACYQFRLTPGGEPKAHARPSVSPAPEILLGPENVNNGWNRAVAGRRNAWVPDLTAQKLPQWVQLDLAQPARVHCVQISFQTRADRGVDFSIQVCDQGSWRTVAQVRDNADRRRVLSFEPVMTDKVRLVLERTAGRVGVCEIRVY